MKETKDKKMKDRKFEKRVLRVIRKSDILLEVLDARFAQETRNFMLEKKVQWMGKGLIVVLNKAELISGQALKALRLKLRRKGFVVVPVSCTERTGKNELKRAISTAEKELGRKMQHRVSQRGLIIGAFGYPNTGKSSLINYLSGRGSARTSAQAAFTRGEQFIRVNEGVLIIDTPGVVSFRGKPWQDLVLLNALSPNQLKDRVAAAERIVKYLLEHNRKGLAGCYGLEIAEGADPYETIEKIAVARNRLVKGGEPDIETMSRMIIADWQRGKIKV
ncbi:MAG: GTPase [Candidatus Diapherotrites archaeon]